MTLTDKENNPLNYYLFNCFSIEQNKGFFIQNNKKEISVQTESKALYEQEENNLIIINKIKINKSRKDSADLIRDKLFKYFNNILYYWIIYSKSENIDIKKYQFEKNNKKCIAEAMNKYLKELFISINEINKIDNNILKQKLDYKYEDIYNIFISEPEESIKNKKLFKNFKYLKDFLKELELKKESEDYILKVKNVALSYEEWKNKKIKIYK